MRCILIDDESNPLDLLSLLIAKHCPSLKIIGKYRDPREGISAILELKPNLVFLDIDMPNINGFDVLEACWDVPFQVVFTTGHGHFAIQAFRYSATDFLLKPINETQLMQAVVKAQNMLTAQELLSQREILLQHLQTEKAQKARIVLPSSKGFSILTINDILYCEAEGNYTCIYCVNEEKPMIFIKPLRELEEMLEPNGFFRAHNSFLINLDRVKDYYKGDNIGVRMANGKVVPVARPKREELLRRLNL